MTEQNAQDQFLSAVISKLPAPSSGLRIYQLNRQALASRALAITFPVTQQLLGTGFDSAVQRFIQQQPPQSADWALAGQHFGHWLEQQSELSSVAYVSAMALLEWQLFLLQGAADPHTDVASYQLLERYSADDLSVALHPLCLSLQSGFPLQQIWLYHQRPADPALLPVIRQAFAATDYVEYLLLTRPQFKAEVTRLTAEQQALLNKCRAGCSLSELLAELALRDLDFSQWFGHMLKVGAVSGFSVRPAFIGADVS